MTLKPEPGAVTRAISQSYSTTCSRRLRPRPAEQEDHFVRRVVHRSLVKRPVFRYWLQPSQQKQSLQMRIGIVRHLERVVFLERQSAIPVTPKDEREGVCLVNLVDCVLAIKTPDRCLRVGRRRPFRLQPLFSYAQRQNLKLRIEHIECQRASLRHMTRDRR